MSSTTNTSIAITDETDNGAFIPSHLDDLGLSPFEFRLYAHIARRAGSGGQCWEGIDKMAKICRMERKTAYKAFQFLEDHKMIRVERKKGATSHITLTNRSSWIPPDQEVVSDRPVRPPHPLKGTSKKKNSGCAENGIGAGCTLNGIPPIPNTEQLPIPETEQPPIPNMVHKGTPLEGTPIEGSPNKNIRADEFFAIAPSSQIQENSFRAQTENPRIQETPNPQSPLSPSAPENLGKAIAPTVAISKQAEAYMQFEQRFSQPKPQNRHAPKLLVEAGYAEWHNGKHPNDWRKSLIDVCIQRKKKRGDEATVGAATDFIFNVMKDCIALGFWGKFQELVDQALKLEAAEAIAAQQKQIEDQRFEQQPSESNAPAMTPELRKQYAAELRRKANNMRLIA